MRIASRIVAGVLALALVAAGILLIVEISVAVLERPPWVVPWDRWWRNAQNQRWSDGDTRLAAVVLVALGVFLLLLGLSRWRPARLPLADAPDMVGGDVRRRALEQSLARQAEAVDGVDRASVRIIGSRARVRVDSTRREPGDLGDRVAGRVAERLEALQLGQPLRVAVDVTAREG